MHLSELKTLPQHAHVTLWREIDRCPSDRIFPVGPCTLPSGCIPSEATVGFFKDGSSYCMMLNRQIRYTGDNEAMKMLSTGEPLSFNGYDKLMAFFYALPSADAVAPAPSHNYDLDSIVNMEELSMPTPTPNRPTPDYISIRQELEKTVMGQDTAILAISHHVALHIRKSNPKKPLSFVAYGPPGTGKSETAKALTKVLSRLGSDQYAEIWTDLNQYTEAHSVHRLIGAPPGYAGYDDKPVFEAVVQNPYSVFIFDELDKAHPEVLKTFMAILDEGRCASRKELADGSREYDFRRCIFIFTSNYVLNVSASTQKKERSFSSEEGKNLNGDGAFEVSYAKDESEEESVSVTQRIYRDTEAARKVFVEAGVLREIASRFNCFVEFKELSVEAKIRILAKQVIETGLEYGIQLTHIAPNIMQALINASTSEEALTVRSFKSVIEGYLAAAFAEVGTDGDGQLVRLVGTLEAPEIIPD